MNHSYLRVIFACTKDINIDNDTVVDAVLNALSSPSINSVNWRTMHKCTCSHTHTHKFLCWFLFVQKCLHFNYLFSFSWIRIYFDQKIDSNGGWGTPPTGHPTKPSIHFVFFFSQRNVHVYMQRVCVLNFKHAVNYVKYLFNVLAV